MDSGDSHETATDLAMVCSEDERLDVIASFGLDALDGDGELDHDANFAARLCDTPIAFVSIVEADRQRFLAAFGSDLSETPRSVSFCAHAMLENELMVVPDATEDARFADNPLVTGGPGIRFYAGAALKTEEGTPIGSLCVMDTAPRPDGLTAFQRDGLAVLGRAVMRRLYCQRADLASERLIESQRAQFMRMAEFMPVMAWSTDPRGKFLYGNRAFHDFAGPNGPTDKRFTPHPEDADKWEKARATCIATGEAWSDELRLLREDGVYRWVLMQALPLLDGHGKVEQWFATATDIDEGHRLSESRDLMARELAHRIKNIFAVITGLVSMRARGKSDVQEFSEQLIQTIHALGRAQDFVRPLTEERGEDLRGLLDVLMAPYAEGERHQVEVEGVTAPIGMRAATPIALIFHELATNSAKYGALSKEGGTVRITLTEGKDTIGIVWTESGGPDVSEPASEGFGTRLLRMSVESQLDGSIKREWNDSGLVVRLVLPRQSIAG